MHKKVAALLLGIGIGMMPWTTFAYNHYAPNSFDEVERYTEGYQAAATLIEAGAAPGYDATLLERPHLTRFELARAVAAMLREGYLTPAESENDARVRIGAVYTTNSKVTTAE